MEYLRNTVARIVTQLEVLSRSQRIAIGLCAALVAGSLFWLVHYSTAPEMTPLLAQNMSLDEIGQVLDTLKQERIGAQQVGSRVLVKVADRDRALLALNRADALPRDTSTGFAELMADSDPFRPSDENKWRRQVALGTELGRILASGDDIQTARVVIQDKSQRRIGVMGDIAPSASVQVKMSRGKALDQAVVDGICRFVAGAVPGLAPHGVTVLDAASGRAFRTPGPEELLGVGLLEEKKKNETHLAAKIHEALQSIPGVLVSVTVELDARRTKTQTQAWSKPEVKFEETTTEVNSAGSGAGETGVNPNVGVALTANPEGSRNESEQGRTEFFDVKPTKVENIEHAPFAVTRATASIGIPRSFLVGIYQARFGAEADPKTLEEDANFQNIRATEIERVQTRVSTILMARSKDDVNVEVFYDFAPEGGELNTFPLSGELAVAQAGGGVADYARKYGAQGVLVVLALVSFFTMARLVRKSSEVVKAVLPPERKVRGDEESEEMLHIAGAGPVGRATATEGLLVGQEVDEETLRFAQLGEQVTTMVESDPQTAAELLRRWAEADH